MRIKLLATVLLQVLTFFYLYSVPLKGMPFGVGTRILFALFGFIIIVFNLTKPKKKTSTIKRSTLYIFISLLIFLVFSVLTLIVNLSVDLSIIKYFSSFLLIMVAGYFLLWSYHMVHPDLNFSTIADYVITAVVMQMIIALAMFLIPGIYHFFISIQQTDAATSERLGVLSGLRLVGFGSTFFTSGIVNGYTLILIVAVIKLNKPKSKALLKYAIAFLLIFTVGMMMARTTLIGASLGLIFLLMPSKRLTVFSKTTYRFFSIIGKLFLVVLLVYLLLPNEDMMLIDNAASFGFEMFLNFMSGEGLSSESTDDLQTMFKWPTSFKTYMIGDGRFLDIKDSSLYYMQTDVGYLRLLYYFGVFGLLSFFLIQYTTLKVGYQLYFKEGRVLLLFFLFNFIYILLLNVKGFTDLFFLNILFCYKFGIQKETK